MESSVRGLSEDGRRHLLAHFDVTEMRAHRRAGWARRLWDEARRQAASPSGRYTVNASSYAVAAYERLGFKAVGAVQEKNGVTFQPMEWARHTVRAPAGRLAPGR